MVPPEPVNGDSGFVDDQLACLLLLARYREL